MVTELQLGVVFTGLAWLGLLVATVHGKYVVEKIAAGEYDKGPLRDRGDER